MSGMVGSAATSRDEPELAVLAVQVFDRELGVDHRAHDAAVMGLQGPVDHQQVAVIDTSPQHRQATRTDEEGRLRMPDQERGQVHRLAVEFQRRRGEACFDRAFDPQQSDRPALGLPDFAEL
jgi:hypothetical protein